MSDLEEGEITDSDSDKEQIESVKEKNKPSEEKSDQVPLTHPGGLSYRNARPQLQYSDQSDSNDSDEDTPLWKCKKAKYFSSNKSKEREMVTELPDEIQSPKKQNGSGVPSSSAKRKINNVWGSVITEQSLTQDLKDVGVKKSIGDKSRSVEKYDFTLAFEDSRPDIASEHVDSGSHDPFDKVVDLPEVSLVRSRKRKIPVKDRVQMDCEVETIQDDPTKDAEDNKIIKMIARKLDEPKLHLIAKIYGVVGKEKTLSTLYKTLDVEEAGGLLVQNGTRRRSPGGVFIHLIKSDKTTTQEQLDEIFADEERKFFEDRKRRNKEKKERKKKMRALQKMLPQSKFVQQKPFNKQKKKDNVCSDDEKSDHRDENETDTMETTDNKTQDIADISESDIVDINIGIDETID